jgi:hypothetical protein
MGENQVISLGGWAVTESGTHPDILCARGPNRLPVAAWPFVVNLVNPGGNSRSKV